MKPARGTTLLIDTLLLGVVGAASAQLFALLLRLAERVFLTGIASYTPPGLPAEGGVLRQVIGAHGLWLVPIATTIGGLIAGFIVYRFAPEAEGHGTDTAVRAFHHEDGVIRARVAPIKLIASAITIGSGGAAGREGPTALISAGFGSYYAKRMRRTPEQRQLLMLVGMAAGLSAIFQSPLGTAIFAIEVLYADMEFESRALLYTLLGSIVAYALNGLIVGWEPLFRVPVGSTITSLPGFAWLLALGIVAGGAGVLVPTVFYHVRDGFRALALPPHVKPAIGGLGVGLLALAVPQVLGGGYGWIQEAIDGRLALGVLAVLTLAKLAGFALTVSSGGSGGVFAPSLYVGAMLGAFVAGIGMQPAAPFVVLGMAALFGAAARVPIATLLMVTEMTGGYGLLVPAAFAVTVAYLVQTAACSWLKPKYRSLYEAQVRTPADSPAHHAEHLRTALTLLDHERLALSEDVGHLNLVGLLKAGIPVDLPGGKRLVLGRVRELESSRGGTIDPRGLLEAESAAELVAVLRSGRVFIPHPNTRIRQGDQVVVLASRDALRGLRSRLAISGDEA